MGGGGVDSCTDAFVGTTGRWEREGCGVEAVGLDVAWERRDGGVTLSGWQAGHWTVPMSNSLPHFGHSHVNIDFQAHCIIRIRLECRTEGSVNRDWHNKVQANLLFFSLHR